MAVTVLVVDKMVNGSRDDTDYFVRAGASDRQADSTKKSIILTEHKA